MADVLFLDDLLCPGDKLAARICSHEPENERARPVYIAICENGDECSVGLTLGQVAELVGFLAMAISTEQTRQLHAESDDAVPDDAGLREEARAVVCRLARERP